MTDDRTNSLSQRLRNIRFDVMERASRGTPTLCLFDGRCGHRWVGAVEGSYGCPVCGDCDGQHHLKSMEAIAVQADDWGTEWNELARMSEARQREREQARRAREHARGAG